MKENKPLPIEKAKELEEILLALENLKFKEFGDTRKAFVAMYIDLQTQGYDVWQYWKRYREWRGK